MHHLTKTVLFESDEVIVIYSSGTSSFMLITFGDAVSLADGLRFSADTVVEKNSLNCIGFMAKSQHWYRSDDMNAAIAVCLPVLSQFAKIIMYGGSMGGYAALKFSKSMGATHVLAQCPQWSIDPEEANGLATGYETSFLPRMSMMGIRSSDISGIVYLLFDHRFEKDRFHRLNILAIYPQAHDLNVIDAGHNITTMMAGSANLMNMLEACLDENKARLKREINLIRRRHKIRRDALICRAAETRPTLAVKLIYKYERLISPSIDRVERLLSPVASFFFQLKDYRQVELILEWVFANVSDIKVLEWARSLQAHLYDHEINSAVYTVHTCHGTFFGYNFLSRRFEHRESLKQDDWKPIYLVKDRLTTTIRVLCNCRLYALTGCDDRNRFIIAANDTNAASSLSLVLHFLTEQNAVAMCINGLFASAEIGGSVAVNRENVGRWESFQIKHVN